MGWLHRILDRIADWMTSDARAEHEHVQQDEQPRHVYRPTDGSDMIASARALSGPEGDGDE